jgi:hypothetical protein
VNVIADGTGDGLMNIFVVPFVLFAKEKTVEFPKLVVVISPMVWQIHNRFGTFRYSKDI